MQLNEETVYFKKELHIDVCDICNKPQNLTMPTEKGWLCRRCFAVVSDKFEEGSEEEWWD
jgi:hypothetical protein